MLNWAGSVSPHAITSLRNAPRPCTKELGCSCCHVTNYAGTMLARLAMRIKPHHTYNINDHCIYPYVCFMPSRWAGLAFTFNLVLFAYFVPGTLSRWHFTIVFYSGSKHNSIVSHHCADSFIRQVFWQHPINCLQIIFCWIRHHICVYTLSPNAVKRTNMTSSKSSSKSPSVVGEKIGELVGRKIGGLVCDRIGGVVEMELQLNPASDAYSSPLHTLLWTQLYAW